MVRHRYGTDIFHDYVRISGCSRVGDSMRRTTTTQGVFIGAGSASMHLVAIRSARFAEPTAGRLLPLRH